MNDIEELQAACRDLHLRLSGNPHWSELNAIYLALVPLVGRIQAAVAERARLHGESDTLHAAEASFQALKASRKQVGVDIRLASEPALRLGLQTAIEQALETLARVAEIDAGGT